MIWTRSSRLLRHGRSFAADRTNNLTHHRPSSSTCAAAAAAAVSSQQQQHHQQYHANSNSFSAASVMIMMAAASGMLTSALLCQCESNRSNTAINDETPIGDDDEEEEEVDEELPTYTADQVSKNNGKEKSDRIWMTYGGNVYDTTDFIANHPGGSEKILLAAGGPVEPHWHLFKQHFASDLPMQLMEKMLIGTLHPTDQDKVDEYMEKLTEKRDPYDDEPIRSPLLKVHGDTPMNAEVPSDLLGTEYITPVDTFYIRHHHPVPLLSEEDEKDFRLDVDLTLLSKETTSSNKHNENDGKQKRTAKLSLAQIKSLPKVEVTTTLQCSGNRRSGFNDFRKTSGTAWSQGAISTAKWGGARLVDVLMLASEQLANSDDEREDGASHRPEEDMASSSSSSSRSNEKGSNNLLQTLQTLQSLLDEHPTLQHLRFESLDGMRASIDILKALSPFGDVVLAYEMNDELLPRDHGYPLRVIVPGYAAVRNVKWVSKLELSEEMATGAWQRGLNYKVLPPSVTDANEVDLDEMPGLAEVSVFSGITNASRVGGGEKKNMVPGETVMVKASGWAWAGGGRKVVRVDVTGNDGASWSNGDITLGSNQPHGRAWAWVFWECPAVPAVVCEDGTSVELSCKAVDSSFNSQPGSSDGIWNVRGLANNSWFRLRHRVV